MPGYVINRTGRVELIRSDVLGRYARKPALLGISGRAQSGKNTVANLLSRYLHAEQFAYADQVREALYAMNPLVYFQPRTRVRDLVDGLGWDMAKKDQEVRALLQRMGTEAGRDIHGDDVWLLALEREMRIGQSVEGPHARSGGSTRAFIRGRINTAIVTDVRVSNEAEHIESLGGVVIEVVRPGAEQPIHGENATHPSEAGLGDYVPHITVHNDGTVYGLGATVRALLGEYLLSPTINTEKEHTA